MAETLEQIANPEAYKKLHPEWYELTDCDVIAQAALTNYNKAKENA